MVKTFFFLLLPVFLLAQEVKVTSEIEGGEGIVGRPLKGTITITHEEKQEVDLKSFQLDKKGLDVEFLRKVQISPKLIISFYRFELPGKKAGLYMLPSVNVQVSGKQYHSIGTTYEVMDSAKPKKAPTTTSTKRRAGPSLNLEASVEGTRPLYPGQRINLVYRILFSGDISLTEENLPLLKAQGFQKIGDTQAKSSVEGNKSLQILSQRVEAVKPGTYTFKPSEIAGYAYTEDATGKRSYFKPLLKAQTPALTLEVLPFPEKGKPPFFNGAAGEYSYGLELLSPPTVKVGDKLTLALNISGKGELENVPIPSICCQPGWSGNFELSDLPPAAKIEGTTKTFTVELRPLSSEIKALPPLAFSFFNPEKKKYETVTSKPIPIEVLATQAKFAVLEEPKEELLKPPPLSIANNFTLTTTDLHNHLFGSWWALLILPIGASSLLLQIYLKNYLKTRVKIVREKNSKELFKEAAKSPPHSSTFFKLIQEALQKFLAERGEDPDSKLSHEVNAFLHSIEEMRFGTKPKKNYEEILKRVKGWIFALFALISFQLSASEEAFLAYERGENAKTVTQREHAFNASLKLYTDLEEEYAPTFGTGKLYYNIGNSFYQLEEYPFALLYYYRAQALMPESPELRKNIENVRKKLELPPLAPKTRIPLPRWIQLTSLLTFLTFLASSVYIWRKKAWLKQLIISLAIPTSLLLIYLGYLFYLSPIEAALVHPTPLYRDADVASSLVQEDPLLAGKKLVVIDLTDEGKWAKVITKEGTIGYIPYTSFRIIL